MKLLSTLKKHLPVSRKTHMKAVQAAHAQGEADTTWLMAQLRQATAANIRLERKLEIKEAPAEA